MVDRVKLNQALDRLRAASLDASAGTAYVCGAPWFRNGSGVLLGSPDPHAGQMIADTDTSLSEPDDHNEIDDDCNALFLAEAWNFARLILGSPELLDRLRASDTGRSEAEASEAQQMMRERIEGLIGIWSMRPPPMSAVGQAWEDGARQGWNWAFDRLCSLKPEDPDHE